jgi:uncharacterized protein YndB with AHSA1/START domain
VRCHAPPEVDCRKGRALTRRARARGFPHEAPIGEVLQDEHPEHDGGRGAEPPAPSTQGVAACQGHHDLVHQVLDEVVAPSLLRFTFTFVDTDGRPVAPSVFPEWPVGVHIVMTIALQASPRGTRMTVHQRVAEPEAAGIPAVVRHHKLAGVGWRQTAARLVEYLRSV